MALHLVTGYAGAEHITSADQGSYNIALMGSGQFVLDRGNRFSVQVVSNNKIRIKDGDFLMQGRHVRLKENTYEELDFDNGSQGMKRNDLIVARYTKNSNTGVESCEFVVLKGTEGITAVDPEYIVGDITEATGDLINDFPLYRVSFNGFTIQQPVPLFQVIPTWKNLVDDAVEEVQTKTDLVLDDFIQNTRSMISDAWNDIKVYTAGEYCIDDNSLWKCLVPNTGIKPTESTYWAKVSVADELRIKDDFEQLTVNNVSGFTKGNVAIAGLFRYGKLRILKCNILGTITQVKQFLTIVTIPEGDRNYGGDINTNYETQNGDKMVCTIKSSGEFQLYVNESTAPQSNIFVCRQTFIWTVE